MTTYTVMCSDTKNGVPCDYTYKTSNGANATYYCSEHAKLGHLTCYIKTADIEDNLNQAEKDFAAAGQKIQAIKAYRMRTGASLLEAKHAVDAYMIDYLAHPDEVSLPDPLLTPPEAGLPGLLTSLTPDGSGKVYYPCNLRVFHTNSIRVQVQKPETAHYYSEHNIAVPADFTAWLGKQVHNGKSMAGSGTAYVKGQVRVYGEALRFQVPGYSLNRSYGAAFTLFSQELLAYLS